MTKQTNQLTTNDESMFNKAADAIGNAASYAADAIEGVAFEAGIVTMNTVRRTERVATTLVKVAPSAWKVAGEQADARIAARLARRGITMN